MIVIDQAHSGALVYFYFFLYPEEQKAKANLHCGVLGSLLNFRAVWKKKILLAQFPSP